MSEIGCRAGSSNVRTENLLWLSKFDEFVLEDVGTCGNGRGDGGRGDGEVVDIGVGTATRSFFFNLLKSEAVVFNVVLGTAEGTPFVFNVEGAFLFSEWQKLLGVG